MCFYWGIILHTHKNWQRPHSFSLVFKGALPKPLLKTESNHTKPEEYKKGKNINEEKNIYERRI